MPNALTVPFWEISHRLKALEADVKYLSLRDPHYLRLKEQAEMSSTNSAALMEAFKEQCPDDADEFHRLLACQTIIAAARGGQLRRLKPHCETPHPFAIRALLPYWVSVEDWGVQATQAHTHEWIRAAVALRPLLAHASLWLGTSPTSDMRSSRSLSAQDVQSLSSHFQEEGRPIVHPSMWSNLDSTYTIKRYLPWLAEDSTLSLQVADAWNAIVDCGEADRISCRCIRCARVVQTRR